MGPEEAKEPGALGEVGQQRPIVTRQPAIEGPVAHAFERMQQPQGDHLTGPEVGLGMCGDRAQLLIDLMNNAVIKSTVIMSSSVPRRVARFQPAWRKCMPMTIRPASTIVFIG